jgi:mannose/cellobiose epimerase-like protein (N-acyl-D-glucosamine 2-epimerase family)
MQLIDFCRVRTWAFDAALPLWAGRGVDWTHGGFEEELYLDGSSADVGFKRTRVAGRQIYVFSHAALLGWRQGAVVAERGVAFLAKHAWLGDDGGWARRLSPKGDVIDDAADLYDLAFVLFGLAWYFRLTRGSYTRDLALRTLAFIQRRMRAGEGFIHELGACGVRVQNPHMHLLEASLAAFEAFAHEAFLDLAHELVRLFRRRFFDGATLAEFFDEEWRRTNRLVEPGHQLEWAWILGAYAKLTGASVRDEAEALTNFAERHGVDQRSQLIMNQINDDGTRVDGGSRTWQNTERIKGHLALFELTGTDPRPGVASSLKALFHYHLADVPSGLWRERFDDRGVSQSKTVPASTLYHLFLAFSELLRLQSRLEALA